MNITYLSLFSHCVKYTALTFIFSLSALTISYAQTYQLNHTADLNRLSANMAWLTPENILSNNTQYLLANQQGQVYLFNQINAEKTSAIGNLNHLLDEGNFVKLTAVAAHPSFALRDQNGTGKLFTAHTEIYDANKKIKRLQAIDNQLSNVFDLVVTEWQLNAVNKKVIARSSKREIIRVSVPNKHFAINQLSFNPYIPSWDDNFGLLHIALSSADESFNNPLFSGVVLRIRPEKFGLKNYTVPANNPFIKHENIASEITLLGTNKVNNIIWQKRNTQQVVISHERDDKQTFSISQLSNDWRNKYSVANHQLWQQTTKGKVSNAIIYSGKNNTELRNQLLFFTQDSSQKTLSFWQLQALNLSQTNSEKKPVQPISAIDAASLLLTNQLSIYQSTDGELNLHDHHNQRLISLVASDVPSTDRNDNNAAVAHFSPENNNEDETGNSMLSMALFIVLMAFLLIIYWVKFHANKLGKHAHLRSFFARFELDPTKKTVQLYRRHRKESATDLAVDDIISSELLLNNRPLNVINSDNNHGFSETIALEIRNAFALENRNKMVDGKVRHVDLILTDIDNKTYPICLYYREGNQRLTKIKYQVALEQCFDWCWFIANYLNPEHSVRQKVNTQPVAKAQDKPRATLSTNPSSRCSKSKVAALNCTDKSKDENETLAQSADEKKAFEHKKDNENSRNISDNVHSDTAIIDALDKLVKLKQQGFIDEQEFDLAKAKLLHNLIEH